MGIFVIGPHAYSADIDVSIAVSQQSITEEDVLTVEVTVNNSSEKPTVKNIENFTIQGTSQSYQTQIINFKSSSSRVYTYQLAPKRKGIFTLGPATILDDGKTYTSNVVQISVGNVSAKPESEKVYFLRTDVSPEVAYVNQPLTYTLRLYTRAQLANINLSLPDFADFLKEEFSKQSQGEEIKNGIRWNVTEIKFALFAQKAKTYSLDPAQISGVAISSGGRGRRGRGVFDSLFDDPFFGGGRSRQINLRSNSPTLQINALPTDTQPANFTGIVGDIKTSAEISKKSLAVGESATLTLILEGRANVRDAQVPKLSWPGIKIYEDQPSVEIFNDKGSFYAKKTFKWALVPSQEGKIELEPVNITYFDPSAAKYKSLQTPRWTLDVHKGQGGESLQHTAGTDSTTNKKSVKVLGQDIVPIKLDLNSVKSAQLKASEKLVWYGLSFLFLIIYTLLLFLNWRRNKLLNSRDALRRQNAMKEFQQGIKSLGRDGSFYDKASLLLRTYIGDKLIIDGKALTSTDAKKQLEKINANPKTVENTAKCLADLEMGQYGGGTASDQEVEKWMGKLKEITQSLEKELR